MCMTFFGIHAVCVGFGKGTNVTPPQVAIFRYSFVNAQSTISCVFASSLDARFSTVLKLTQTS